MSKSFGSQTYSRFVFRKKKLAAFWPNWKPEARLLFPINRPRLTCVRADRTGKIPKNASDCECLIFSRLITKNRVFAPNYKNNRQASWYWPEFRMRSLSRNLHALIYINSNNKLKFRSYTFLHKCRAHTYPRSFRILQTVDDEPIIFCFILVDWWAAVNLISKMRQIRKQQLAQKVKCPLK